MGTVNPILQTITNKWAQSKYGFDTTKIDSLLEETYLQKELISKKITITQNDQEFLKSMGLNIRLSNIKEQNSRHADLIKTSEQEGKDIVKELIKINNDGKGGYIGLSGVDKIKTVLSRINKDNVAYVVKYMPNIADFINDIDALGMGLDTKDVFQSIINPLARKAYGQFTITLDMGDEFCVIKPEGLAEIDYMQTKSKFNLDDMKEIIRQLSKGIQIRDKSFIQQYELMNKEV